MATTVYAYVTNETCVSLRVFLPGGEYKGKPVAEHGDLRPWCYGIRETKERAESHPSAYERAAARAVLGVVVNATRRAA